MDIQTEIIKKTQNFVLNHDWGDVGTEVLFVKAIVSRFVRQLAKPHGLTPDIVLSDDQTLLYLDWAPIK